MTVASGASAQATARTGISRAKKREWSWGLLFLSPWLLGFLCFTGLPILATLYYSFTDYNLVRPDEIKLIGLGNYQRIGTGVTTKGSRVWVTEIYLRAC